MIKEIHGMARAGKLTAMGDVETQEVRVKDGSVKVVLVLSANSYPATLTPDEADFIANCLLKSANRVREANKRATTAK